MHAVAAVHQRPSHPSLVPSTPGNPIWFEFVSSNRLKELVPPPPPPLLPPLVLSSPCAPLRPLTTTSSAARGVGGKRSNEPTSEGAASLGFLACEWLGNGVADKLAKQGARMHPVCEEAAAAFVEAQQLARAIQCHMLNTWTYIQATDEFLGHKAERAQSRATSLKKNSPKRSRQSTRTPSVHCLVRRSDLVFCSLCGRRSTLGSDPKDRFLTGRCAAGKRFRAFLHLGHQPVPQVSAARGPGRWICSVCKVGSQQMPSQQCIGVKRPIAFQTGSPHKQTRFDMAPCAQGAIAMFFAPKRKFDPGVGGVQVPDTFEPTRSRARLA